MQRDRIIELADKAFSTPGVQPAFKNGFYTITPEELIRFAALIAAEVAPKAQDRVSMQWLAEMIMSDCGCSTSSY